MGKPLMDYCEFFATENEAIAHCRECNAGAFEHGPWLLRHGGRTRRTRQLPSGRFGDREELTDDGQGAPHLIVT